MHTTFRSFKSAVLFAACLVAAAASALAADSPDAVAEKERELIGVLRSDAPGGEKALACKRLAVYGSDKAVPELAELLKNEQLASWARIALEAIPGPAADEALRNSLDGLQGQLLVGAINSIGVRRDAQATAALAGRLANDDAEVASCAAAALGRIGDDAATKSLRQSLAKAPAKVRSAIAEGLVLCAERLQKEGRQQEAVELFDEVRKAEVPKQRKLEATRGAILARNEQDGIKLLIEQFRSPDKALFQLALGTIREFPGKQIDQALADELAHAAPARAAVLIHAMADRNETVVLAAVLRAAESGEKPVRLAALGALGRVGNASCLSPLLAVAIEGDAEVAQTAKAALASLPGEDVNRELVARLAKASGKTYPVLIELIGERRIEAIEALVKALDDDQADVRSAALTSLGNTVPANRLSVLISQVVAPKHADDAATAQQALKTACTRMPDRDACATELAAALGDSPTPTKVALLETLGAVGGAKALAVVGAQAKSTDPELQDVSSRLLGEWMTIDAAPVLLDLAKSAPGEKYQNRALRGYIRIARQFVMPEPQRAEMCRNAFAAARQPAEQKLVLEVLKRYPNQATLKLAAAAMEVAAVKPEATDAALAIAQKLGGKGEAVRQVLSKIEPGKHKVEIVKAEYGAGEKQKDVTDLVGKQVIGLPLIVLPADNYNAAFGGDPAPGTSKQLKIKYRINGKEGEATFAENAVIVLPAPK